MASSGCGDCHWRLPLYFLLPESIKDAIRWNFPEIENVQPTCRMHILCMLKNIGYHSGARIQCTILKGQVAHVEKNPLISVTSIP